MDTAGEQTCMTYPRHKQKSELFSFQILSKAGYRAYFVYSDTFSYKIQI